MNSIEDIEKKLESAKSELQFWGSTEKNRKSHQYQMSQALVKSLQKQLNELIDKKDI